MEDLDDLDEPEEEAADADEHEDDEGDRESPREVQLPARGGPPAAEAPAPPAVPQAAILEEVKNLNYEASEHLKDGDHEAALRSLRRAEELAQPVGGILLALTESTYATAYKQQAKWPEAEEHLLRSLDLEQQSGAEKMALVTTHLNLCAVQAKLERFEPALQNAMDALDLTTQHVRSREASEAPPSVGDYTCLAVAYLNIGTCREKLRRWSEAAMAYRQGFEVSSRCLGLRHPLTLVLADNSGADVGNDFRIALPLPGLKPVLGHASAKDVKVSGCTITRPFPAGPQLAEYALPHMKQWPPPNCTDEEKLWYSYAHPQERKKKLSLNSQRRADYGGATTTAERFPAGRLQKDGASRPKRRSSPARGREEPARAGPSLRGAGPSKHSERSGFPGSGAFAESSAHGRALGRERTGLTDFEDAPDFDDQEAEEEAAAEEELAEEELEAAAEEDLRYEDAQLGYGRDAVNEASFYGSAVASEPRTAPPEEPMPDFLPASDSALPFASPSARAEAVQPPTPPSAGLRGPTTAMPAAGPATLGAPMTSGIGAPLAPMGVPPMAAEFGAELPDFPPGPQDEPDGRRASAADRAPPLVFVARRPDPKAKKEPPPLRRPEPKRRVYHFRVEEPPVPTLAEKKQAEKIQRTWREHQSGEDLKRAEADKRSTAAVRLQAWGRMRIVRGRYLNDHARVIQRVYRMFRARIQIQRTMDKIKRLMAAG